MSTDIKNGKHHTNHIYIVALIFLFIVQGNSTGSASPVKNEKGWVIVIDAGHGGKDPGALGANSSEKDITLPIALKTGEYIEKYIRNVTVIYTRKTDKFVEVRERANIANKANADLFISIHANSTKSKTIHGTETFVMGPAKDQQNLEVAIKENEVILLENDHSTKYEGFDPSSPESYIMFSLMQNIFQEQSTALATKIQSQYAEKIDRTDRGVKQAGFWVLFMTTMPSVLTEAGFITHPSEEAYLNSKAGQDHLASSIYRACSEYLNDIDNKSSMFQLKEQYPVLKPEIPSPVNMKAGDIKFMIQIATSSSRTEIKPENFNGLTDVAEIKTEERFKYVCGNFDDYLSAVKFREKIESLYPGAFVIAVRDNKILPLQQAMEQIKQK